MILLQVASVTGVVREARYADLHCKRAALTWPERAAQTQPGKYFSNLITHHNICNKLTSTSARKLRY